ncbi:MAG TPA: hypothetical protein VGC79_10215 [Polyangiaceae bacterium]
MRLTVVLALVALGLGSAGGAAIAWRLKAGQVAAAENKDLRARTEQLVDLADKQQQQIATQVTEFAAAVTRLNGISQGREDDQKQLRVAADSLARDLDALRRAEPHLAACELGDGFLRHWNQANGAGASDSADAPEPAADAAGEPAGSVPIITTAGRVDARQSVIPARSRSIDVSRLREPPGAPAGGGDGVGSNQLALVLPGVAAAVAAAAEVRP